MITQWNIVIRPTAEHPLHADSAYRLYAFLLEQLPAKEAAQLHEAGGGILSQFVHFRRESSMYSWIINVFSSEMEAILSPVLTHLPEVKVEGVALEVVERSHHDVTAEELILSGREQDSERSVFVFDSPTAFKQNSRYAIFPGERLMLQSLTSRWNDVFPEYPIDDRDAFEALLSGIHIVDYRLRTTRFQIKGVKIPGFVGSCTVASRLPCPLLELWKTLVRFAGYAGIGIKTGLGMGGVHIEGDEK